MRLALLFLALASLVACDDGPADPISRDCFGQPEGGLCVGARYVECGPGGAFVRGRDCSKDGLVCDPDHGCRRCVPSAYSCDGNTLLRCDAEGKELTEIGDCGELQCSRGGCVDLCAEAEARRSYFGCRYHPTVTMNSGLDRGFAFALAIANEELVPADVRVRRAGVEVARVTVPPGGMETLELPWVLELKEPAGTTIAAGGTSTLVSDGAFELVSSVPVTVHQFNPLDYARPCEGGRCHSYTNDASLLLPDHVLGDRYRVVSRPSFAVIEDGNPIQHSGFFTVVAVGDEPVDVEIVPAAPTAASEDGLVPALEPGESFVVTLQPRDVLQVASRPIEGFESFETCPGTVRRDTLWEWEAIYCDPGRALDLTGSEIRASGPVAVFSGHDCTFVPFDRWACDHLEEALFPLESWGKRAFAARPFVISSEPYRLRIVSGADGNLVSFTPPVHPEVELDAGDFVEIQTEEDVLVTGTDALLGVQFLVGQGFSGGRGDPSMALIPPIEQYRRRYSFLRVSNFEDGYVNVVAVGDAVVRLDGKVVSTFTEHESGLRTARVQIGPGFHEATSEGGTFGLSVYGYGAYTSYFLPAGLDVVPIFVIPP